jgi:hypothetical protein
MAFERIRTVVAAFGAVSLVTIAAAADLRKELVSALPAAAQAKPWTPMVETTTYGEGIGLTEIYDGGYKKYLDNGVVAAVRRVYRKGGLVAEVVLHRMKSARAAKKLGAIKKSELGKAAVKQVAASAAISGGFIVRQPAMAMAIVWGGRERPHLCTIVISGRGADREPDPAALAIAAVRNAAGAPGGAKKAKQ